jgi:hypothetical protein
MGITESKAAVMKTRLYASEEGNEYPLSEINPQLCSPNIIYLIEYDR